MEEALWGPKCLQVSFKCLRKTPEIHVPEMRALKSGAPRLEEMLVCPRKDGTSNRKGRELLTEDQAGTQAHSHIKRIFFLLDVSGGISSMPAALRVMSLVGASNR